MWQKIRYIGGFVNLCGATATNQRAEWCLLCHNNLSFVHPESCFQKQDPGTCQNYTMMWFFDTEQNECSRFWYSGCDGNANRFNTQEDCENLCLTKSRWGRRQCSIGSARIAAHQIFIIRKSSDTHLQEKADFVKDFKAFNHSLVSFC